MRIFSMPRRDPGRCPKTRRSLFLVVFVFAMLVWTVVFSNWNVCRSDLDDDVDALNVDAAAGSRTGSSRHSAKICLSSETDSGLRVNMSIDSDNDLQRYSVSASAVKPYTSIIHAMYTTSEIPIRWKQSAESWVNMNKDFAYCLWTFAELEVFVADEYPWLLSTYQGYRYFIQRCDVARYMLLYRYGGTYVDLDVVCRTPLSVIFADSPVEAGTVVRPASSFGFSQDFIAVRRPRDPFIRGVLSGLRRAAASWLYAPLPYTSVVYRTGPMYFTRRVNCHDRQDQIFVIPWSKYQNYFDCVDGSSWHSWDGWIIWNVYLLRHQILRLIILLIALAAFVWLYRTLRSIANYLHKKL